MMDEELTYIVCANRCDEKQPFQQRLRKTFRKAKDGFLYCPECWRPDR